MRISFHPECNKMMKNIFFVYTVHKIYGRTSIKLSNVNWPVSLWKFCRTKLERWIFPLICMESYPWIVREKKTHDKHKGCRVVLYIQVIIFAASCLQWDSVLKGILLDDSIHRCFKNAWLHVFGEVRGMCLIISHPNNY